MSSTWTILSDFVRLVLDDYRKKNLFICPEFRLEIERNLPGLLKSNDHHLSTLIIVHFSLKRCSVRLFCA